MLYKLGKHEQQIYEIFHSSWPRASLSGNMHMRVYYRQPIKRWVLVDFCMAVENIILQNGNGKIKIKIIVTSQHARMHAWKWIRLSYFDDAKTDRARDACYISDLHASLFYLLSDAYCQKYQLTYANSKINNNSWNSYQACRDFVPHLKWVCFLSLDSMPAFSPRVAASI